MPFLPANEIFTFAGTWSDGTLVFYNTQGDLPTEVISNISYEDPLMFWLEISAWILN